MDDCLPVVSTRDMFLTSVPVAGKRVVDIGCGEGRMARTLADHGQAASVLGVECSARQLAKAAALPPHPAVTVVEGIGQSLPLDSGAADVAVFFNSLHHVPADDMDQALREAARVVVSGGLVCSVEPIARGAFFALCQPVDDETPVRAAAQAALARAPQNGLQLDRRLTYLNPVKMRNFEEFRERMVSANNEREALFAAREDELRRMFDKSADRRDEEGAALFLQPSILTILRRP